ncbi:MAG TPA: DUF4386 domain-containing protein [Pirellulales bacterium]|jgi:hypothetical protein
MSVREMNMNAPTPSERITDRSPRYLARTAGVSYLLNILTTLIAVFLFRGLILPSDPGTTATNVLMHESSFRGAIAFELISTACSVAVAVVFYALFRPVTRTWSLMAGAFRLIACAIFAVSYLFQVAPLVILSGAHYLDVLQHEQLQMLALLSLKLASQVRNIALVFFGFHFLFLGFLIVKSRFLPSILGVLCALAGIGALLFLAPPLANQLFGYIVAAGLLAEASLTLWLLVRGVDNQKWIEQNQAAESKAL